MATLSDIRQTVIDWIEDDSDSTLIDRTINSQLRFIAKREFESLYRTADVEPDSGGIITSPPVCSTILGVYPQTSYGSLPSFAFMPRTGRPRGDEPRTNRYLYHPSESTRISEISDVSITAVQGSQTIGLSGAITESMTDGEFRIEGDSTRYLIVSHIIGISMSVFPSVRIQPAASASGTYNPLGTKRYVLTDPNGSLYTEIVTVDYQIDHPPLVFDDDDLIIPMERTLALLTVQQFLQQSKYDVDAERLDRSIFEARLIEYGTEPSNRQDNAPKDTMFSFRSKRGGRGRR